MSWGRGATVPPPGHVVLQPLGDRGWQVGCGWLVGADWLVFSGRLAVWQAVWAYKPMLQILAPSISTRALTCMPGW